ncbi:MAG: hypothetical protein IPN09_14935 [Bacteroidetes bacterium]|nr:hypothetical protein [Bacteroidota bacterium]
MNKLFTTLLLFVFLNLEAQISKIKLTDYQFKKIESLVTQPNGDSLKLALLEFKQADTTFSTWHDSTFLQIVAILKPSNSKAYINYKKAYDISFKIADDLVKDVSDDQNLIRQAVYFGKEQFLKPNLTRYIQNQFFDFYYNNNAMAGLDNPEYVAVLKPKAVYKLLLYAKPEAILKEEIDFIALNSNFKF